MAIYWQTNRLIESDASPPGLPPIWGTARWSAWRDWLPWWDLPWDAEEVSQILAMTNMAMERSIILHGKNHYFYYLWWFSIVMLAKLVQITPISLWFFVGDISIMGFINQLWGAPPCRFCNGHFRNRLIGGTYPYVRPFVREYPHKIWS